MSENHNVARDFHATAERHAGRLAVAAGGAGCSYGELAEIAARLAALLVENRRTARVGILATRSIEAYAGILGAAWSGATYVPLNLKWPQERLLALAAALRLDALVADRNGATLLSDALSTPEPKQRERRTTAYQEFQRRAVSNTVEPERL